MGCVGRCRAQPIRFAEHAALRTERLKHGIAAGYLLDRHYAADHSDANNGDAVSTARGREQPGVVG